MHSTDKTIVPQHTTDSPYAEARDALERENPQSWVWDDDGNELAGRLLGDDTGKTRDGDSVPIKIIRTDDGAARSLWLFESPKMLPELFAENHPSVGDYVMVRRYPKRKTQDGERTYWPFAMSVVPATGGELDGISDEAAATEAALADEKDERDALASVQAPLGVE